MSVDPSLSCTGVALIDIPATARWKLTEGYETASLVGHRVDSNSIVDFVERSRSIVADVARMQVAFKPDRILVEVPEGKVNVGHTGMGAGLSKYGFHAGMMFMSLNVLAKCVVTPIGSSYWTQGMSKDKRKKKALSAFPSLASIKDPGYDVSDATAMAVWWLEIGKDKPRCLSL